jgi:D-alanine-D-alanine ligase
VGPGLASYPIAMKITVLADVECEGADCDVVAEQVRKALAERGHRASILPVHGDLKKMLASLARRAPEVVFNLVESFDGETGGDIGVAGVLELLKLRYTGSGPGELYLCQDKALAKKVLAFEQIPYPDFAIFSHQAGFETGGSLRMPLFVKPLTADASIGISGDSLVRDVEQLVDRVRDIHKKVGDAALAEEYIEGREFYIGVLGNGEPTALPPIEMDFSGLPEGMPRVVDAKAKWAKGSVEYKGTESRLAEDLPDDLKARLQKTAVDAYRALRVRDYGRVDLRLADTGEIYVLEVNASCYLESGSEFATAAAAAGIEYPDLVDRIARMAAERSS